MHYINKSVLAFYNLMCNLGELLSAWYAKRLGEEGGMKGKLGMKGELSTKLIKGPNHAD